ncbi:DUF2101 family protein [Methanobacterium ferruginis]|uniref:DUF2101 family protein n=1 Tax=Methanobacterium ferruginis TaxID=710191 RepID=UPI00257251C0|nr:DUF2101 family protein [Methanobacterium ferruginis]BDZ68444.1 hypothetical protein GCM10025860_18920 [Methanobacterium ferruginis]
MGFFARFGDLIITMFSLMGKLITSIPRIPKKLRNVDQQRLKGKIDRENIKKNVSKVKDNLGVDEKISKTPVKKQNHHSHEGVTETTPKVHKGISEGSQSDVILIAAPFTSKEKEDTVFRLQLLSAGFLIVSVIFLFNFLSFILYAILAILLVGYIIYLLFTRVKLMYGSEFPAYRDFFLMYIAVGIILVVVGTNSNLVMAFSLSYFPSLTILIFAIIAVAVVYLLFRIIYHRDFTYGVVIETGENLAYVKVEYDIRSNVKPDIYVVDNKYGATTGDEVKLKTEQKLFSNSGNKPISILETINKI